MVKSLLFLIAILVTSNFEVTPSYAAGCGTHTVYGSVICRDYEGQVVSNSHCNRYTSEIGSRPPVPRRECPNTCCTETHTVDGVVVGKPEVKVAGSCSSTSRTTTCEERGDCPVEPEPEGETCAIVNVDEYRTIPQTCPEGGEGTLEITEKRTMTQNADCSQSYSNWAYDQVETNTCTSPTCEVVSVDSYRTLPGTCPDGQEGTYEITEKQTMTQNADCSQTTSDWTYHNVETNTCAPTCINGSNTEARTRQENCPSGQTGSITIQEERAIITRADCTQTAGNWQRVGTINNCPTCPNVTRNVFTPYGREHCNSFEVEYNKTLTVNGTIKTITVNPSNCQETTGNLLEHTITINCGN